MRAIRLLIFFSFLSQCCHSQRWDSLYNGVNQNITCLYTDTISNKLYVGGIFTRVNHDTIWGIANWSNNQWDSLGHGMDRYPMGPYPPGSTWGIARYGNYIYTGGNFRVAGNIYTSALSRWDGNNWDSVPGGKINQGGVIRGMNVYNNELYICGDFDSVGNNYFHKIAKWDGITWQSIGNNYNFSNPGIMSRLAFYHGNLYISGTFDDPSGNNCSLAKWDGSNWQFFSNILNGGLDNICDMEVYNNELYVGGLFYTSSGNAGTSIMRWNDTTWNAVGGSIQIGSLNPYPTIKDMCVHNGKLYCAGNFEKIGGVPAMGLASWNGTNWCGFNTFFCNSLLQYGGADRVAFYNDTMYVSGPFLQTDSATANYHEIAKWIGGNYVDTCGAITTGINENETADFSVQLIPNPVIQNGIFQITGLDGNKTLIIYDQLGREIWRKESGENQIEFSAEGFSSGMYFYQVVEKDNIKASGKFIVQH